MVWDWLMWLIVSSDSLTDDVHAVLSDHSTRQHSKVILLITDNHSVSCIASTLNASHTREEASQHPFIPKRPFVSKSHEPGFYLHPHWGVHPSHLKIPPGYTLPAPPLAGSPCNHWYNQYITNMFALRKLFYFVFLEWLWRSQVAPNFKCSREAYSAPQTL